MVRLAPVTCVALSQAALASAYLLKTVELSIGSGRQLLAIRLDLGNSTVPDAIASLESYDFATRGDVEGIADEIERRVRALIATPASGSTSTRSAGASAKSAGNTAREIALSFGDSESSETWPMNGDLRRILEGAARLHPGHVPAPKHPISFATLLASLFRTTSTWSQWCHSIAKETGLDTEKLRPVPESPIDVSPPFRTTSSVASLLGSARRYADRSGIELDVPHLIAALIHAPAGHESELESLGFDRVAWANALVVEGERRLQKAAPLFRALRDESFPVSSSPRPEQPADQTSVGDANAPAQDTAEAKPTPAEEIWATAGNSMRELLAWAHALSLTSEQPGVIGVRSLFAATLRVLPDEIIALLVNAASGLAVNKGEASWEPFYRRLGLRTDLDPSPPALDALPARTAEVDELLAMALALQRRLDQSALDTGFVFLACWRPREAGNPAAIDALLPALDLDGDAFLRSLQFEAEKEDTGDEAAALLVQEILELRGAFRPWERPHVDNDRVGGAIAPDRDLLDARKPALRFAKLLAARDVKPPIALGLFGNWGSGKTFFMGLMRDRIENLAKHGGPAYVRRPVQIEFNAWHYHDTNLWASLAMRIFEELARELGGPNESDLEAKRKELHQRLRSSETRRNEAEEVRRQALERRRQAAKKLERKQAERESKQQASIGLRFAAAWTNVATADSFRKLRGVAQGLAAHFGIPAAVHSAKDLERLRRDVVATRDQALGLFTAVGHRFRDLGTGARTTGWLVLVASVVLVFGWGIEGLAERLKVVLPAFSATMIQIATMFSAAAAWCGRRVKETQGALDTIAKVEADLAKAEKQIGADPDLTKLQAEIEVLDKEIHQASEEVGAAEHEISEATAEIDRINRGGLVYDFLQDRRTSASYVGQLGLISTIRQDLDRLGKLLDDYGKHGTEPIDRIVLYIDDLDRCHPDKVVEVLQAVHLLLAFDLFNVVVGVDARWLERSLRRQYVGKGGGRQRPEDPFSPHDYLEKIFQIPYALSPMGEDGFKRLVGGLIETRSEWTEKVKSKAREAEEKARADAEALRKQEEETAAGAHERVQGANRDDELREREPKDEREEEPAETAATATEQSGNGELSQSASPALYFEDHEQEFIQQLHAFMDRPRLAKRFINIYRLLRVRADDEGESARFAGASSSMEYRAASILLAIHVGHPGVAAKVVQAVERAPHDGTWPKLLEDLEAGRFEGIALDARERAEMAVVAAKLSELGERIPHALDSFRRWSSRVCCYSFDWHRPAVAGRIGA